MDIREWNRQLVTAVFHDRADVAPEIRRIDATDSFLAEVGGFADSAAARESFLEAMPSTEIGVRGLFDGAVLRNWSPHAPELPFYAQLHLSILAASADESLQDEGNFRSRLAQMLRLPDKDYVSGGCLPKLWAHAQLWSQRRFERHRDTRRLVLPDPRGETIIGYSKGLAFPGFRDQNRLAEVFTDKGVDASSPLSHLRSALRARFNAFSQRFREEFVQFERLLDQGEREGARDTVFWETIVETTWTRAHGRSRLRVAGCRIELDPIDPHDLGLWLYCKDTSDGGRGWKTDSKDRLSNGLIAWRSTTCSSPGGLFDLLRIKWREQELRSLIGDRLGRALAEGCVGFVQDEEGRWFDTPALPEAGALWLVLHRDNDPLLTAPSGGNRGAVVYRVPLVGSSAWTLFGPIKVTESTRDWFEARAFTLDFFAPRLLRRRLTVVDSIRRSDGAHLYLPPIVPAFRCAGARSGIAMFDGETSHRFRLLPQDDRLVLPEQAWGEPRPDLELRVVAKDAAGKELARSHFRFCDASSALGLKTVRSPGNWLESGLVGRLRKFSLDPGSLQGTEAEDDSTTPSRSLRPLHVTDAHVRAPVAVDPADLDERWRRTTEILSAIFTRRYAWPVGECAVLLEALWGSRRESWARLGDLVENGVLRLLHARHWSNRVVVAGLPVMVFHPQQDVIEVRFVGLMSAAMRALADQALGGRSRLIVSPDRSTAGALLHHVDGVERLEALHAETGWSLMRCDALKEPKVPSFETVFASSARSDLNGYDDREKVTWSSRLGAFLPGTGAAGDVPRLERWRAARLQDLYVLFRRDGDRWNTDCRTWALLALSVDAGAVLGEVLSDGTLQLTDRSLSLPTPLAWRTVAIGGGVCFRQGDGRRVYPAGADWSPSGACARWLRIGTRVSDRPRGHRAARDRYAFLLERARRTHRWP